MIPAGFRAGLRHLTVLPVAFREDESRLAPAAALPWFPVIGLVVGAPAFAALLLPLPALPRAALALAAWVAVTGGLHEDGFLDCADAALAPVPRQRRLEILKDPHLGAHAATAGTLLMILRFSALTAVPPAAVLVAAVLGRWTMAVTLTRGRPARDRGLGASFADGASAVGASLVALALIAALSIAAGPGRCALALGSAAAAGGATALFLSRRFGGLTGDGHGAAGLVAEVAALFAFLLPHGATP